MNGAHELSLLKHILGSLLYKKRKTLDESREKISLEATVGGSITVKMRSEIPLGSGLGSSAAWGASLSAAFLHSLTFILED